MNTQKVEHVGRDEQQRLDRAGVTRRAESGVEPLHRIRREVSRYRREAHHACAVRAMFRDVVVRRFPPATTTGRELEQITVQLQHDPRRQPDVLGMAVNRAQDLSIARDLLLGTIRRRGAARDEVPDALKGRDDPLNPIGRFGAVDDGVLAQGLEHLRRLLFEERLLAAVLADEPDTRTISA